MGFLHVCAWRRRTQGDATMWKWLTWRLGFVHENFSQFHPLFPPQKVTFQSCLAWPPSSCLAFEHSSTKMGSLDIDPVYSTLCPRITSACSTSKFHFNMLQNSVSGLVMLDAFTYGKDCKGCLHLGKPSLFVLCYEQWCIVMPRPLQWPKWTMYGLFRREAALIKVVR